jgi:hypothetical protein
VQLAEPCNQSSRLLKRRKRQLPLVSTPFRVIRQNSMPQATIWWTLFLPVDDSRVLDAAQLEWEQRKDTDLADYWPRSDIPFGHMTHQRQPLPQHGYLKWSDMFNARQMLVHTQLLKAIVNVGTYDWATREYVLGAFQNHLRNQNMFSFWHIKLDKLAPALSNNNFHPRAMLLKLESSHRWDMVRGCQRLKY